MANPNSFQSRSIASADPSTPHLAIKLREAPLKMTPGGRSAIKWHLTECGNEHVPGWMLPGDVFAGFPGDRSILNALCPLLRFLSRCIESY